MALPAGNRGARERRTGSRHRLNLPAAQDRSGSRRCLETAMKRLVFGAGGQDGYYLDALLRREGIEAVGVSRSGPWLRGDVGKRADVEDAIRTVRPDYVFHLAACSTTHHDAGFANHEAIATGALNILESAYRHAPDA